MSSAEPTEQIFAGKFRLLKMLGRGAMGEVWLATEEGPRNFSRQVAVKRLLATEGISDVARQSFVAEAQALARLDHPNIVRLIELGESDDRGLYLVLDYVDGAALDKIIRKTGQLPAHTVALIGREVAKALDAVHSLSDDYGQNLGVVHRDVSPANILIGRDGRIRLSDFGVARITGLGGEKTETGVFKGKLPYMPPEQALGEPFDGRADLFSLGITIFEALIGGRLRKAETQGQLIARIATERPPRVHERAPETPPALAHAIDFATEFKSIDRVANAGQFALLLHQVLYQMGPGAEEAAVNDIRDRIAATTSSANPATRAPWSLALSAENPAYGTYPGPVSSGNPSSPSGEHTASSGSWGGSRPVTSGSGHFVQGPPTSSGPHQGAHSAPPSQVTKISSITDASLIAPAPPPRRAWIWVSAAGAVGAGLAAALFLTLQNKPAAPADTATTRSSDEPAPATSGPAPSGTVTGTTSATGEVAVSGSTTPSATTSGAPSSKVAINNHVGPGPAPAPSDTEEESTAPGTIQVVVLPWGAVTIDGRSVGTTPIAPVSVPPGPHTVTVTNSELGATRSASVKVLPGKPAFVKFDLKKAGDK